MSTFKQLQFEQLTNAMQRSDVVTMRELLCNFSLLMPPRNLPDTEINNLLFLNYISKTTTLATLANTPEIIFELLAAGFEPFVLESYLNDNGNMFGQQAFDARKANINASNENDQVYNNTPVFENYPRLGLE